MSLDVETILRTICASIGVQSVQCDDGMLPFFNHQNNTIPIGQSFCMPTKNNKTLVATLDGDKFSIKVGSPYFRLFESDLNDPKSLPGFDDIKKIAVNIFKTDHSTMMIDIGKYRFQMAENGLKMSVWDKDKYSDG